MKTRQTETSAQIRQNEDEVLIDKSPTLEQSEKALLHTPLNLLFETEPTVVEES
ncbi:hypothetical protein [Suttonella ornithocola]|uniref:hypothetical protein n=1 Tax=Suttonella ornithocola TaxID=279832 RepID=UPI001470DEF2|nr:hypothetical protein [Suttonella ornithocola]